MNGYEITAKSYEKLLDREKETMSETAIEETERKIKVFNMLAAVSDKEKYIMFDSSMFNEIFKGYVQKIMDELCSEDSEVAEAAQEIRGKVIGKASAILDRMGAEAAEEYYLKG